MKKISIIALCAAAMFACKKAENPVPQVNPSGDVFITNEGLFQSGSGALSLYSTNVNQIENDVYMDKNNVPLGNVLQSAALSGDNIYLVINNSQEVVVANASTLLHKAVISGFQSPRYMLPISANTAYVSDWISNSIKVVDLNSNTIVNSVGVGQGPETMLEKDGKVYVANSGGFGKDSTVFVIDASSNTVAQQIVVGINPAFLAEDANGKLWVLCAGFSDWQNPANDIAGSLYQIDPATNSVVQHFDFPSTSNHPARLATNNAQTTLYYLSSGYGGDVYKMNISDTTLPSAKFIGGTFYALGVHPQTDEIFTSNPLDYNQRGTVYRYTSSASLQDSAKAGIIPGNFVFK